MNISSTGLANLISLGLKCVLNVQSMPDGALEEKSDINDKLGH
jgi:hypothetical protein